VGDAVPYVVYGVVALIAAAVGLVLPETLNKPIPDTLEDVKAMKRTRSNLDPAEDKVCFNFKDRAAWQAFASREGETGLGRCCSS